MNNFRDTFLSQHATLREALEIIDRGGMKIALVVDGRGRLLGTLADGDIRRAFLRGTQLTDGIADIYHRNPTTCGINDSREHLLTLAAASRLYQIPILDAEGVVTGIAEVGELLQPARRNNKVVLMAGGLGTRLKPLTDSVPKPMLKVGTKPILETIIENFAKYGYTEIVLSVNYKANVIREYFEDGSQCGVNISYITEESRMGTAGALSMMRGEMTAPFFVMNADVLTNVNFEHMADFHVSHDAAATMAVREYDFQVPYGVVNLDNGRIRSIEEKPVHKCFVSAGIYMLSPMVLEFVPDGVFFDMPSLFEKVIAAGENVHSFPIREYWLDIGKHSDFERANNDYLTVFK